MILALILFAGMQGQGQTPRTCWQPVNGEMKADLCGVLIEGNVFQNSWVEGREGAGKPHPPVAAKPEPMVQPAIQVSDGGSYEPMDCFHHLTAAPTSSNRYECHVDKSGVMRFLEWTCADPERVLLTTESGRKLCVRFEEEN